MNISVEFSDEIERALEQQAAARGVDVPTYVRQLITERVALQEVADKKESSYAPAGTHFPERLRRWIQLHPTHGSPVDDSRESIYAGRDE